MKLRFNTGAQYTPEGQIIEAELTRIEEFDSNSSATAIVTFHDVSRQIKGKFETITFDFDTENDIKKCIIQRYRSGQYTEI